MDKSFEKFRGGPTTAPQNRIHISISRHSRFVLNNNLYRLLGRPSAVYLFYSREKDTIALESASARVAESFPLLENPNSGWRINAAPFCRHFGIEIDTTLRFIDPQIDGSTLQLKLSDTVSVATVKRRKKNRK